MSAVLLTSLLINNIDRYSFIFVTFFSPLIIYIVIKTSFDAYQSNIVTKFSIRYYGKVFVMTLITQAITLCFTLLSATLSARGIIYNQTVTLLLGYVA